MSVTEDARPAVTVVVPVWGSYAEIFLGQALISLLDQDATTEVVVVDNASSPPVSLEDDRVRVIRSPRRVSCGSARNLGLHEVRTPLVMMWDADDVMLPGTIEFLRDRLEIEPELIAYAAAIIDPHTGVRHRWPRRWIAHLTHRPRLLAALNSIWSLYPTNGATLMRTDVVRHAGGFPKDDPVSEDWSLGVALLWRGRVGWSERPARLYRRHPAASWNRNSGMRRLLANARAVRRSLRRDPAVPLWFSRCLPLVQIAQYTAVVVVQPVLRLARGGRRV